MRDHASILAEDVLAPQADIEGQPILRGARSQLNVQIQRFAARMHRNPIGPSDEDLTCGAYRRLPDVALLTVVTDVDELTENLPHKFDLRQNYPNPFNPSTTIRYGLPHKSRVLLTIFSTLGQQVAILVQGEQGAGYHEVRFDGSGLSSGVYFYRMAAGDYVATKKLLLLK